MHGTGFLIASGRRTCPSKPLHRASHIIPFLRQLLANPTSHWVLVTIPEGHTSNSPLQGYRQSHVKLCSEVPSFLPKRDCF